MARYGKSVRNKFRKIRLGSFLILREEAFPDRLRRDKGSLVIQLLMSFLTLYNCFPFPFDLALKLYTIDRPPLLFRLGEKIICYSEINARGESENICQVV